MACEFPATDVTGDGVEHVLDVEEEEGAVWDGDVDVAFELDKSRVDHVVQASFDGDAHLTGRK